MSLILHNTLGSYFPSFFVLNLKIPKTVDDLNKMTESDKAVFAHEYVHFLQDITTTYGLRNCIHIVDILKTYNQHILKSESTEYVVPIIIPSNDVAGLNIDLVSLYLGHDDQYDDFVISDISSHPNNLISRYEQVPIVNISFNKPSRSVDFGVSAILESQAYLIESELFTGPPVPDYPYRAVEKVVSHLYPELAKSKLFLVALCDISLLADFNGGHYLYETVLRMKADGFKPKDYHEIYDYGLNGSIEHDGTTYTVIEFFEHMSNIAEKQLGDYFTNKFSSLIKDWIQDIVRRVRGLRSENPAYLTELIVGTEEEKQRRLASLSHSIGTPVIRRIDGHFFVSEGSEKVNVQIFGAIRNIFNLFANGKTACDMVDFCSREVNNQVSYLCREQPWENAKKERLCPYAQLWKMWGLTEMTPIRET